MVLLTVSVECAQSGQERSVPTARGKKLQKCVSLAENVRFLLNSLKYSLGDSHSIQGDLALHGLSFVDTFVKCSAGHWVVAVLPELPTLKVTKHRSRSWSVTL